MAQTITYNDLIDFQYIYTATTGGTVFSANQVAATVFDYFSNGAVVGDAIYFGFSNPRMLAKGIQFYIGTALTASSITLVWEYYRGGSTWTTLTGVVDGSSNFTATGLREVSWDWPTSAVNYISVNGQYCDWIRCRITAVSGITEGGAQSIQKVQARNGAVTISNPGATTSGFCAAAYAADQTGGWGVVKKLGANTYYFNCHLFVGYTADASATNLSDTLKHIEMDGVIWSRKGNATITLGTLVSAVNKTSKDGCALNCTKLLCSGFNGSGNERWELYSCVLDKGSLYSVCTAYNSITNDGPTYGTQLNGNGVLVENVLMQNIRPDFISNSVAPSASIKNIRVSGATSAIRMEHQSWLRQLVNIDCTYIGDANYTASNDFDTVLIDPQSPSYNILWNSIPTNRGQVLSRNYTLNYTVLDSNSSPIQDVKLAIFSTSGYNATGVASGRSSNAPGLSGTAFTVDTNVWSVGDYLRIGAETVLITAGTYPSYIIARSQNGSLASNHLNTKPIIRIYPCVTTDATGKTSEIVVETHRYKWQSGYNPGVTQTISVGPFVAVIAKYGYVTQRVSLDIAAPVVTSVALSTNKIISASETTAAAYTGIAINGSAKTITLTQTHTMQELYDYTQWWACQTANLQYVEPITTTDGQTFASTYALTIDGCALSGSGALNLGANTLSLTNGGSSTLNITAADGTHTTIALTGLVSGSRVQLYDTVAAAEICNAVVNATSLTIPTIWTVDHTIRVRVMYVSGATAMRWYETTGSLTKNGMTVNVDQSSDTVYNAIGIDGSTVTECSIVGSSLIINVDDPDNTTTAQRLYAFEVYWLSTESGIHDQTLYIDATDSTHFIFEGGLKIRNSNLLRPLQIVGGNVVPTTGPATDVMDLTGGPIFLNFNRVEGFAYMTQGGLTTAEHDALLDAQSQAKLIRKLQTNKAIISAGGGVVTVYDDNGVTPLATWNISDDRNTRERVL